MDESPPVPTPSRRAGRRSFLAELPGLLLAALVVAVLIKTFVVQPFYIPSGSMIPTLLEDDRVMVSKLNYRFTSPSPGDVIVFENPYAPEIDESLPEIAVRSVLEALGIRTSASDDLIKRVIAVPGQEFAIEDGQVLIDGEPLAEPYLSEGTAMADEDPVVVQPGHVWVMGDNRLHSSDSRVFGEVPFEDVVGKAVLRIWPLDRIGGL